MVQRIDNDTRQKLIHAAVEGLKYCYAPYSGFYVSAALLGKSGKIYTGCNIENSAYTPSNCAERTAFFKAVSEGEREFKAIAIVGGRHGEVKDICPPCGVCRQVMMEFCEPDDFEIILNGVNGEVSYTLSELLPVSFGAEKITYC